MNVLISQTQAVLQDVYWYLSKIDEPTYSQPLDLFSGSTIGQHTRHLLEFFQCLLVQGDEPGGLVNYDSRQRELAIEQNPRVALSILDRIVRTLPSFTTDHPLRLQSSYSGTLIMDTSLFRELLYNIEHAVHHLAIIRIGLAAMAPDLLLPEHFGVAASTVAFRQASGQVK